MFRFKQFTIQDEFCAMKVGTDGVLLGAWATCHNAQHILDVGTGSGLLALMLAQRTPANVSIDAIEIDEAASKQAQINVQYSKWHDRIIVYNSSLQKFATTATKLYDTIICNPPFFSNSLQAATPERNLARHNSQLPFDVLLYHVARLLSPQGCFNLILPYTDFPRFVQLALLEQLYPQRQVHVAAHPHKAPKRSLLTLSPQANTPCQPEYLYLYPHKDTQEYSSEYKQLTDNFYYQP
jgi:tRNA1Val (adenine37-N6)-methyltransferase